MPGLSKILFDIDGVIAESAPGYRLGGGQSRQEFLATLHDLHADSSAACCWLEDNGVAYVLSDIHSLIRIADSLLDSGHDGNACVLHCLAGGDLRAHGVNGRRRRAYEDDAVFHAGGCEVGILRKEAVTGMDGLSSGIHSSFNYIVDTQVTLAGGGRPDEDCFVCIFGEKGVLVRFRVDGHCRDAKLPAGAHHPYGDLSPIGYQDLVEHSM